MFKDFDNIDKLAQDAFEGFEVDFNPEDWKRMEAKLDKKEHLLPHIWLFKGVEAMLLLMILFTSFHFWYSNRANNSSSVNANELGLNATEKNLTTNNNAATTAETQLLSDAAEAESKINTDTKDDAKENVVNTTTNEAFVPGYVGASANNNKTKTASANENSGFLPKDAKTLINKEKNVGTVNKEKLENNNFNNNNLNNNILSNNKTINNSTTNTKNKTTQTSTLGKDKANTMLPPTIATDNKPSNATKAESPITATATENSEQGKTANNVLAETTGENNSDASQALSNLLLEPIKLDKNTLKGPGNGGGDEEGKGFAIKNNFKFPKVYRRQARFSLFAGADVSFANDLGDNNIGLSTGVLFEREISERFSLRSGLLTSRKNYENTFVKTIDHSATEGMIYESKVYQKTSLSVLSVPVYFTGVLFRKEKWRLSLSVGASAAFLTNRMVSGTQRTTVYQAAGSVMALTELNPSAYEKGIFQGGNAQTNMYMTASIGTDIERQLGNRVTLFIQPMYHHALMSVGSGKDRLHTVSLNVGIKGVLR